MHCMHMHMHMHMHKIMPYDERLYFVPPVLTPTAFFGYILLIQKNMIRTAYESHTHRTHAGCARV
jgi:hypothetical protein